MADQITAGMTGGTLRTNLNANITVGNSYETRTYWKGKKVVFLGDSITFRDTWCITLCGIMGWTYVKATQNLAIAGSGMMPYTNLFAVGDNSVYKRCDLVSALTPDIIFITAGENDSISLPLVPGQEAYTGPTLPTGDPGLPGLVGAMKGCLKKLREGSPLATIVFQTNFIHAGYSNAQEKMNRHEVFSKECGFYGATYLNNLNVGMFTADIHPEDPEQIRWANWIARNFVF